MPHHHHSHSKASSTSSASITSPTVSVSGHKTKSPHTSVKVLPATPTNSTFPTNIRLVRAPLSEGGAAFGVQPPPSPGLIFAKRKRSPFKGPMLNLSTGSPAARGRNFSEGAGSRSTSIQGRRSGEIMGIAEEEEDEEEVEEVEEFSPITGGCVEVLEETTAGAETPSENNTAAKDKDSEKKAGGLLLGKLLEERDEVPPVVPGKEDEKPAPPPKRE
ncbi:hypothetical protein N0V90_003286 [Kalmusia sp. IMI 367209]|nr:hypothetical protein N0V90_003286 [Kalmusia sp. IMI 367209]